MRTVYFKMLCGDTLSVEVAEADLAGLEGGFARAHGSDAVLVMDGTFSLPARQVAYLRVGATPE